MEERAALRTKFVETFGKLLLDCEFSSRYTPPSRSPPVLQIARLLEAQQHAISLLRNELSGEVLRRQVAEKHASTIEEAFETLHLRVQAQFPGSLAEPKEGEVRQTVSEHPAIEDTSPNDRAGCSAKEAQDASRTDPGPTMGPGADPLPRAPVSPKEKKPVPPPQFSRLPSALRNRRRIGSQCQTAQQEEPPAGSSG